MPPQQKRHIVKTGNAGNSSKPTKPTEATDGAAKPDAPPSLFPAGMKTPLSLLYERCQKNGWEKPIVEPRQNRGGTWNCAITLRRKNVKTASIDTVFMSPHPPLEMPSAQEAKHWGATYALHRFANNRSYHLFLPAGPKEYWKDLQKQRESAEPHQAWMWAADPFPAQKEVEERQAKAAQKREELERERQEGGSAAAKPKVAKGWENAAEVRMTQDLRDLTEVAIKSMREQFPNLSLPSELPSSAPTPEGSALAEQLLSLGFPASLVSDAVSQPSPNFTAALSYLLLHTPEALLPAAFSATTSSAPFIVAGHSNSADSNLARRWAGNTLVEIGWPRAAVEALDKGGQWDGTVANGLEILSARLCDVILDTTAQETELDSAARQDELDALEAIHPEMTRNDERSEYVLPVQNSPLSLHIILPSTHPYPSAGNTRPPPFYIASNPSYSNAAKVTSWARLGLARELFLLARSEWADWLQDGQGIIGLMVEWLESNWEESAESIEPGEIVQVLLPRPTLNIEARPTGKHAELVIDHRPTRQRRAQRLDDRRERALFAELQSSPAYVQMIRERQKLPAFGMKDQIVETIRSNKVTVVVGETGCGKTTQLPQFILDDYLASSDNSSQPLSILITQPRRLSAIGVSSRVAAERCEPQVGQGTVGYAIRGETRSSNRTRLLFVTTGVALRMLMNADGLSDFTHVVVDEVHERSVDSDFLLLELKELLLRGAKLKVVLMSATINQEVFVQYFDNAPVLSIPGYTHPVNDHYLEDIIPHISYRPSFVKPRQKQSEERQAAYRQQYLDLGLNSDQVQAIENISRSDRIDFQLIAAIVGHIVRQSSDDGAILIFMPGVAEIKQCINSLDSLANTVPLPLHANLSPAEQKQVFLPVPKGRRKIVVATNVAETSITIPDITHVVDAGRVKENEFDPDSGLSKLTERWVSKAGARQRRGRAGRTKQGECWKAYTRRMEMDYMASFSEPEILRVPLDRLALQVKVAREDEDVKVFLSKAISPPKLAAMDQAWTTLKQLGAVDDSDSLTSLGRHLALLPMDLRLAKMLILAAMFRCLNPILTVVACLSSKPLFNSPIEKRDEAKRARNKFMTGNSDLLTDVAAYESCQGIGRGGPRLKAFSETSFISLSSVRDISSLRQEFYASLSDIGFVPFSSNPADKALNLNSDNQNLLKAVILGGLWPRIARIALPKASFERVQAGTIQKDHEAKELKFFDAVNRRVFLHPSSVLFSSTSFRSPFVAYFSKHETSKVFLRDATEVPLYGILLFGGTVNNDPMKGGLTVDGWIRMRAWSRIGVLANQLRQCLDELLSDSFEKASLTDLVNSPVCEAMLRLLDRDGLSADTL